MKIFNNNSRHIGSDNKSGFIFAVSALGVSIIVGLIVVFLFNTVTLETTTASHTLAARVAFWKALSRVRMLEQLIKDYGFNTVSEGGLIGNVTFYPIDDCHRRVVSEIRIGDFTRIVQGILENQLCDAEAAPNYSMVHKVDNDNYHPGHGHCNGWRHWGYGRGLSSWGWRLGTGSCTDLWGWHWDPPCDDDDDDDDENNNNNDDDDENNNNDDDDDDDDDESQYGWFNIKGWDGILDGEIYIGANTLIEYNGTVTRPHVGWDNLYSTNFKLPPTCAVLPAVPLTGNSYTWENVDVLDLPDFDHLSYDSLFTIALTMTEDNNNGKYVGDIEWSYDHAYGNTTIFYLQNYPNRTLFVRGDCEIKSCELQNIGGSSSAPGIIVATGDISVDSLTGGTIPNNIILIAAGDIDIEDTNFGTDLPQISWDSVVNELYARGQINVRDSNRILAQIYAFGGNHNSYSYRSQDVNTYGLIYLPNPDNYLDLASRKWFKGAMYVSRVKNDRFQDTYVLFHRKFPTHYFPGGITGLYGGADINGQNWVLVTGSLQEI